MPVHLAQHACILSNFSSLSPPRVRLAKYSFVAACPCYCLVSDTQSIPSRVLGNASISCNLRMSFVWLYFSFCESPLFPSFNSIDRHLIHCPTYTSASRPIAHVPLSAYSFRQPRLFPPILSRPALLKLSRRHTPRLRNLSITVLQL